MSDQADVMHYYEAKPFEAMMTNRDLGPLGKAEPRT